MVKRLNSTNEGWLGNEYHYTGRDKINYIARTNSLGNWEYRATNGPSTWQAMPKGYQTTGGFKFDNNSAWNRRTNENSYMNQANENMRKISKNADLLTKARQRANRNVRAPFVNNTADLQSALWYAGAFNGLKDRHGRDVTYETATDGIRGNVTNQAIQNAVKMGYNVDINKGTISKSNPQLSSQQTEELVPRSNANYIEDNGDFLSNLLKFSSNIARSPIQSLIDGELYLADKLGAPSNATNYLRDLNVSIPYRIKSGIQGAVNTLINGKPFSENYQNALANPGLFTRLTTIHPLTNNEGNFNNDEMNIIREMAGNKSNITNSDIRRVGGRYGAAGLVNEYFSPVKIVQTALGQTSGKDGTLTDLFDVNTLSDEAKRDNQMYLDMAKKNPGFNYQTLRAAMPYLNMIDIMPDEYKIHSNINLGK